MSDKQLNTLIAHYLATHARPALHPFLAASDTPAPDLSNPPNPDLLTLVTDARAAQLASQLNNIHIAPVDDLKALLAEPLPSSDKLRSDRAFEHITDGNLTAVAVADLPRRSFNTATAEYETRHARSIVVGGADRTIRIVDWESGEVVQMLQGKAPVLCLAIHPKNSRYVVSGGMDGALMLWDTVTHTALQTFSGAKFVVRVSFSKDGRWLAAASYDKSVSVYEALGAAQHTETGDEDADAWLHALDPNDDADAAADPELRYELKKRVVTQGNPEALLFHPASSWLMYTQRESPELHYLGLPSSPSTEGWEWPTRTKSFNAHALDTHVSFAVLDLALHPSGRLIGAITGDHAGPGAERILLYGVEPDETERLACLWTRSEPDAFVLPRLAFLPSGKGIVTTNANGELTLLSLQGEVRNKLKVHAARAGVAGTSDVVRDLAVVPLGDEGGWEVVSVGYDRTIQMTLGRK
ncbi:WD40 repeat-like protein [Cutaneotrichosporon oleaginosum]|uniref:WD40 repeat-like protein n=1 Tax=Cutaneotrichosporon oleaginosum TaxID=879819 RepID=A0A0J0XN14_9TREE|nr:WD40 repeat-like protein [Cutaneotrichosporon oleaginosum]KLT42510.1 WD40 repeat-like protein [Cutaneotrichosporon oleaginosum]TXT07782.1 hypothetical protein COLE_04706 [Cutaneotrichosporon oleaginosum]